MNGSYSRRSAPITRFMHQSPCADHAVAYKMRALLSLDGIPGDVGLNGSDNILYAPSGTPPTGFQHPHCVASDITPE